MPSRHHRNRPKRNASHGISREASKICNKPWEGRLITTAPKQVLSPAADVASGAEDGNPSTTERRTARKWPRQGPSRSGIIKPSAMFLVEDRDADDDRMGTQASKCHVSVRSAGGGLKKTGFAKPETPVHQSKHPADSSRTSRAYAFPRRAQVATVGGSVMLFLFIFLLAAYFIWPRGSRNPRRKSSGGTTSSASTSVTAHDPSLCSSADQLSVWIESGEIRGRWTRRKPGAAGSGKKQVRQFFGIPYGRSTSGDRRFNYSEETDMPGVFQAYQHGPHCFQPSSKMAEINMSEECLTLSIWTPFMCSREESLKTVVVVVSSKWFVTGHASDHEDVCREIASSDVVVVAINFRLGAFGFLRAPAEDMPSNVGFSDLVRALSWLRSNVAAFHGEPNSMVGMGLGSGGLLLSLDLLAPAFQMAGYFKRLFLHGLVAGSLLPRNRGTDNARELAGNLKDCSRSSKAVNVTELLKCLRSVSAMALLAASVRLKLPFRFVPNLESNTESGHVPSAAVAPWSSMPLRPLKGVSVLCGYSWESGRELFDAVIARATAISAKTPPRQVIARVAYFFTARSSPNLLDELPKSVVDVLSQPSNSGVVEFIADAVYYCPLMEMASAVTKMEGEAFVYANYKRKAFGPPLNLSDTIAFIKSGTVPWSAFGAAKAVYVDNGTHRDVFFNWRSERCNWVQKLSRRLQEVQR
ncbi:hypothetical protein HPB50_024547 [Hyalomma asiaticum]|uniref:Uncharacterized protein n=1 Tax=Hyalomma asiaticum TaxID=266040 RepID=A0ACB7SIS2_HYAAI|nr:hypothetical protein HPB50_024547 [Hyalomma asiaticum]